MAAVVTTVRRLSGGLAVAAIVAACGSGGGSGANSNGGAPAGNAGPAATLAPGLAELDGTVGAFQALQSYGFTLTVQGSEFGGLYAQTKAPATQPLTASGTVIVKPSGAAAVTTAGYQLVETGGSDYVARGTSTTFTATSDSAASLADLFAPDQIFGSVFDPAMASGFSKVGPETKDGVTADHFTASAKAFTEFASVNGLPAATWTGDIWIAQGGGYPVSFSIEAKASGSVIYELSFDLERVNSPTNAVAKPTKVAG